MLDLDFNEAAEVAMTEGPYCSTDRRFLQADEYALAGFGFVHVTTEAKVGQPGRGHTTAEGDSVVIDPPGTYLIEYPTTGYKDLPIESPDIPGH